MGLRRKRRSQQTKAHEGTSIEKIDHDGVLQSFSFLLLRRIVAVVRSLATSRRRMTADHADCGYANQLQSERSSLADRRDTISRGADSTGTEM
jgi:hypothetical protein